MFVLLFMSKHIYIFTAPVHSTREGNVLTPVCVSVHTCRGGYPISGSQVWGGGGYPIPGLAGGGVLHPRSGLEGTLSQVWIGWIPPPKTWDGVPPCTLDRVPPQDLGQGTPTPSPEMGYLPWTWDGVPPLDKGWGTPPRQISIASTCYAAGGMPLAFTQEDFLVLHKYLNIEVCDVNVVT